MYRLFSLFYIVTLAASLGACSTQSVLSNLPNALKPYQVEIVQGNFVSKEQVAALHTGMQQVQVRNILGTPLLTDVFHADRWDYVFYYKNYDEFSKPRRLTVYFKANVLDHWEGDTMPSEAEFVKSLTSGRKIGAIPPLVASESDLAKFAAQNNTKSTNPTTNTVAETSLTPPNKVYPPLE